MAFSDFSTEGAPIPATSAVVGKTTTSTLPDWYSNYAVDLLSKRNVSGLTQQQYQQQQQQQQQGGQAQQQPYQQSLQNTLATKQQGGQAQQQPYSPYGDPIEEGYQNYYRAQQPYQPPYAQQPMAAQQQPYPQAPTQSSFAVPQPMSQQPMSQQPMSQQPMSQQPMSQPLMPQQQQQQQQFARQQNLQLPGYPTQPDVIPYNNGGSMQPKPMYTPMDNLKHLDGTPYGPPTPPSPFQSTVGAYNMYPKQPDVNPYNSPMYPKQPDVNPSPGFTPGPTPLPSTIVRPMSSYNPVAMARGGLFAVNRPAPRVSSMAVKQGRI